MGIDDILINLTDLHQHLGFSSTPHFLWELAHEQGIRLKEKNYWKFIDSITVDKTTTQKNYHDLFDYTQRIQSSPYAVENAVHNAISYSYRKANVTFIEIKLNPMRRNKGGEHDLDKIILSACYGLKKVCLEYPIKAGIIIEMDRRFNKEQNEILCKKAIAFKNDGVVGVDLSGPENKKFKIDSVVKMFKLAKDAGLGITVHTGELPPVEEVEEVIEKIKPHRIGHGVRSIDNKKVLQKIASEKIVLEICPSSNLATKVMRDWKEIKNLINTLKKHNVYYTINSDCPTLIHTNVKEEYKKLYEYNILTLNDIKYLINFSRQKSFIRS